MRGDTTCERGHNKDDSTDDGYTDDDSTDSTTHTSEVVQSGLTHQ